MCQTNDPASPSAPTPTPASLPGAPLPGTRRRRLWDLGQGAHCPLVGVCIPIATLRRLVDKLVGGQTVASDYDLHSGAVAECRSRNRLSEALQKHLDLRHALVVRRSAALKTTPALAAWWAESAAGIDLPGTLWALLSHPRCTPELEEAVLGQVHMLQHQVGAASRADLARLAALNEEQARLSRELADVQARSMRQAAEMARRMEELEARLVRQRAQLLARETELAMAREQLAALQAGAPELAARHERHAELRGLRQQLADLQRQLGLEREQALHQRERARALQIQLDERAGASPEALPPAADGARWLHGTVLCVGGRPASVPLYRLVVERTGGRFLHHDGGDEQSVARLEATLAAADLVICQTGCVSHDAYWRVKDHCKRTGKRCVFVESPSRAALERALGDAAEALSRG
jgi:hypothetical protein